MIKQTLRQIYEGIHKVFFKCLPGSSLQFGPPRGYWKTVDSAIAANSPGVEVTEVLKEQRIIFPEAVTVDPNPHWKLVDVEMTVPPQRLTKLRGGRLFGMNPIVIDSSDHVFHDLSTLWRPYRHPVFHSPKLPPVRKLKGKTLCLATLPADDNIGHLLFEALPGLRQLELGGIDKQAFDHFVVGGSAHSFLRSILDIFDIPEEKRIYLKPDLHIECEELVVPTLTGRGSLRPDWVIEYLRKVVFEKIAAQNVVPPSYPKRIYVSRENARFRKVANREELWPILEKYGYEKILPENFSYLEQAAMFSKAERVCTAHGAGLCHILYVPVGCKVLEMFPTKFVNPEFFAQCEALGLEYHYLVSKGEREPIRTDKNYAVDVACRFDEVECDIDLFEKALARMEQD